MKLIVYSDGVSIENLGISTMAFMVLSEDDGTLKRYSKYMEMRTDNQVEYGI